MNTELEKVYTDIEIILNDWKEICRDHKLLEKENFLNQMHSHILTLDSHCKQVKKYKKIHNLLFHILHTPGGAPVATEKTLYTSAKEFSSGDAKDSSLHDFLKKSLTSSDEADNFLFNSLSFLEEELKIAA